MIPQLPRLKPLVFLVPFLFAAFSPMSGERGASDVSTEFYYNLPSLKQAGPPRVVDMIKTDNAALGKRVIRRGTLITYQNRAAATVRIAGDFNTWRPEPMIRSAAGVWYHFLPFGSESAKASRGQDNSAAPKPVRYKLLVDTIWITDPRNPEQADDGAGSFVSLIAPGEKPERRHDTYRFLSRDTVEFRIHQPHARYVAIVGDFNSWNPENDRLTKSRSGFWKLTKRLAPGTYRYQYIVDGAWQPDIYNTKSSGDGMGGICSLIVVR